VSSDWQKKTKKKTGEAIGVRPNLATSWPVALIIAFRLQATAAVCLELQAANNPHINRVLFHRERSKQDHTASHPRGQYSPPLSSRERRISHRERERDAQREPRIERNKEKRNEMK
jgi:hypothetical protein